MNLAGILTGVRFTIRHPDTDKPLSFGKVYTYEDNSLIPKDTWKDENKKAINTNPIILDASGQCDLFLDGVYRIVVKDNNDLIINTIDRVRDGATVAREFAEELINGYAQLNLDPTILNPVAENTVNIVAIGENIDSVVTDALNIEAIKTNALNINSINTNATNIATIQTASANAIIAEQQAQLATTKASESLVNANNAKASELLSAQYKADNESIKTNVQTLSNSASNSANTASIKANEASDSAIVSTTQANISITKASEASTYATNSNTSAVNASASENKAEEWASKEYGLEVEPGLYSAKHYAITAQTVLNNKVDKVSKQALDSNSALRVTGTTVSLYKGDGTFDSITTQDTIYTLPTATSTVKGGIEIFSDTVQTTAANAVSTSAGRTYGIQLNSAGQAVVNVPWSDTNTVYTHPNSGVTAGTYSKVTVNTQGHITNGSSLSASDIPSLDASKITSGTIDSARLPSFVDDVLEFVNLAGFPTIGETGKIYIALDTNKTYRWSGSTYVYITSGAVDSVAGKTGIVTLVKGDVGLGNVDNTSDLNKPISTATQTALNLKVDKITGKGLSTEDYTTADKTKLAGLSNYTLPIASTTVLGGVKAGTNISIDANGVISANDTSIAWSEITSKPTTLSGYGITDSIQSTLVSGTSIKTINGTSILGSGDISTIQTTITGNAGTATKLQTARTIGGVSFDGSANINLPGVNIAGNQSTTGNAGSATKLATARTINGVSFDGTANITIADNTKVPLNGTGATGTWGINISGNSSTATTLTGLTATIAELNYNGGVTSNIQTQLNNKASNDIVTTTTNGLMASADKVKLNSLENYTLPNASATTLGGIKVGSNLSIDANGVLNALAASSISWTNITDKPTTISGYGITDAYTKTEVGTLAEFTTNLG